MFKASEKSANRRDTEGKEKGKDIFTQLNAEFWRIARRDKKAFLSEQCKDTEENNRMGKTREILKKIRDTKGTFHSVRHGVSLMHIAPFCSNASLQAIHVLSV